MLLIIACHFSVHGGFSFSAGSITLNRLWTQFIRMGGALGNDIFVLISGYFLINSSGINYHRLFNLWIRIFFYSATIYLLFVFFDLEPFSAKNMFWIIRPVTTSIWWFASTYFVLYLIHPYINIMIKALTREECTKFIKALVIYWSIIPMVGKTSFGSNFLTNFICLYCFSAYIRLWCDDFRGKKYILLGILCIAVNFLSVIILDFAKIKFIPHPHYFTEMMMPLTLLACAFLLVGFKSLDIPYSKTINLLASATFGVYLIHDNNFMRPFLWHNVFKNASFQVSPYLIPYSIAVILTVYISCTVIELIRAKIFKTLSGGRLS